MEDAEACDSLVFIFASHGIQQRDLLTDEENCIYKCILATDLSKIVDDYLWKELVGPLKNSFASRPSLTAAAAAWASTSWASTSPQFATLVRDCAKSRRCSSAPRVADMHRIATCTEGYHACLT